MIYNCRKVETDKDIKLFLSLPKKLYRTNNNFQDRRSERQLLRNKHALSQDFKLIAFIVTYNEQIVSRCTLTVYLGSNVGYLGHFESTNNMQAVRLMLNEVKKEALEIGLEKLVGPIDSSIWIKYRFKINYLDRHFTGEPYNLSYYRQLWERLGFRITEEYYSNQLRVPEEDDINEKYVKRLDDALGKGYKIVHPNLFTFRKNLKDIYKLIMNTYCRFPYFRKIDEKQFIKLYGKLGFIINNKMVYLAYKDNTLAGFMLCIPNYDKSKLPGILKIIKKPNEYIIMHLAVDKNNYGLGGAFAELCKEDLEYNEWTSIMALIHSGNKSGVFYKELTTDRYDYVLMELDLLKEETEEEF